MNVEGVRMRNDRGGGKAREKKGEGAGRVGGGAE